MYTKNYFMNFYDKWWCPCRVGLMDFLLLMSVLLSAWFGLCNILSHPYVQTVHTACKFSFKHENFWDCLNKKVKFVIFIYEIKTVHFPLLIEFSLGHASFLWFRNSTIYHVPVNDFQVYRGFSSWFRINYQYIQGGAYLHLFL